MTTGKVEEKAKTTMNSASLCHRESEKKTLVGEKPSQNTGSVIFCFTRCHTNLNRRKNCQTQIFEVRTTPHKQTNRYQFFISKNNSNT